MLVTAPEPSVSGQSITATAVLSVTSPGSDDLGRPTGTLSFQVWPNGGTTWAVIAGCGAVPVAWNVSVQAETASCTMVPARDAELRVAYSGDMNFVGSTSSLLTPTIGRAATAVTVTSSPNPSTPGTAVTL
jgi:hypothetical protein